MALFTVESISSASDAKLQKIFKFAGVSLPSIEKIEACLDQVSATSDRLDTLIKRISNFLYLPEAEMTVVKFNRLVNTLKEGLPASYSATIQDISNLEELEELRCDLISQKKKLNEDKKTVARHLSSLYRFGGEIGTGSPFIITSPVVPIPRKQRKYQKMAGRGEDPTSWSEWLIDWHAFIHSPRLFLVRLARLLSIFIASVFVLINCFAWKFVMGILAISYVVGVVSVIIDAYHFALDKEGSFDWSLFKEAWRENGWRRAYLLFNDFTWMIVNSVSFVLLLINPIVTEIHSFWNILLKDNHAIKVSDAINDEVNELGFAADIRGDGGSAYQRSKPPYMALKPINEAEEARKKEQLYKLVRFNVLKTAEDKDYRFYRSTAVAVLILSGMFFFYIGALFPAIHLLGLSALACKIIGASCALMGSCWGGLGARIRDHEIYKNFSESLGEKWDSFKYAFLYNEPSVILPATISTSPALSVTQNFGNTPLTTLPVTDLLAPSPTQSSSIASPMTSLAPPPEDTPALPGFPLTQCSSSSSSPRLPQAEVDESLKMRKTRSEPSRLPLSSLKLKRSQSTPSLTLLKKQILSEHKSAFSPNALSSIPLLPLDNEHITVRSEKREVRLEELSAAPSEMAATRPLQNEWPYFFNSRKRSNSVPILPVLTYDQDKKNTPFVS